MISSIFSAANTTLPKPRRSANYEPPSFDADFLNSVTVDPLDESQTRRIDELQTKVAHYLSAYISKPTMLLELIDCLQQLGIRYRFEDEIVQALKHVSHHREQVLLKKDLYYTSLLFRLFRESGLEISPDAFESFCDENNGWVACFLRNNPRGILSLYEASYLAFEDEALLDEIKSVTTDFLLELHASTVDNNLKEKVRYALDMPLHWRPPRFHTMWFMNTYAEDEDKDPELLELARLDFNRVQLLHRREIKETSRWWNEIGLGEELCFFRNRAVENFLWALGSSGEPRYGKSREWVVRATCIAAAVDDTYDVYGTLDELQMFTDIVERWAVEDIHKLPGYMQILFMALFNHVNDLVYHVLKDKKVITTLQARRMWVQLCKAYFLEAKWYHNCTTPTYEEFLNTSSISAGAILCLSYASIISSKDEDTIKTLDWIHENKGLARLSGLILRFTNDLGCSKKERERGDAPNAMECYMHQQNVSEEEARNYIHYEINQSWKNINKNKFKDPLLPKSLIDGFIDLGRVCHFIYHRGDGFGYAMKELRASLMPLLFESIPLGI